jgi:2,3,4,5-tetrahydropyridine-2-carboxylate N-succinyltransferase
MNFSFEENVNSLRSANDIEKIEIIKNGEIIRVIKNDVMTKGSLKIFAHLVDFDNGSIYFDDAKAGLKLYAEMADDARKNPGKHKNIDTLLNLKENEYLKIVVHYFVNENLRENIERFVLMNKKGKLFDEKIAALAAFNELMDLLEAGFIKTAQIIDGKWQTNTWVKEGIMLGFALGNIKVCGSGDIKFIDKDTFPLRKISDNSGIRLVPPTTGIRRGAFAGRGTVFLPPAFANIGAHIGCKTVIEGIAGNCCQVGGDCRISSGAVIGGAFAPIDATPVIIGNNVLLGETSSITQGSRIDDLVTLAPGVHISKETPVIDTIKGVAYTTNGICELTEHKMGDIKLYGTGKLITPKDNSYGPEIPSGALIIPGLSIGGLGTPKITPIVAKYITHKSQRIHALEETLRD